MFWGLIMEPNKRYTQVVEKPFHISQAAMDISTGDNDACQVMVVVDGKNFLVCTLQKNKCIQVPLDLYFKAGDNIAFLTNGKCNVHLTGYLDPEFEEEVSDEDDEEDEEEEVPAGQKRKSDNSIEVVSKKAKKEKPTKKKAPADSSDSDNADQLQKFLDGEDVDTDENDESFKMNTSGEASASDEEESDEHEAEDEEEEVEEEQKGSSDEAETTMDTSKEEEKVDMSKLSKSQRRRLKKKMQQANKAEQPQVNGVEKVKKDKADKKKPEAKKDAQDGQVDKKEKKSLSGGVFIEDLKVGSGPVAKPGKVVMVYYEGRLKQNNKMFDSCLKGPGFKFKLGAKEVISGWDVGISGMKVGGKRKIICPPPMAYGAKGCPPAIPANSTLVFEVELKNLK